LDDLGGARWDVLRSSAAAGRGGAARMGVVAGDGAYGMDGEGTGFLGG
jgi:hypothetical protein